MFSDYCAYSSLSIAFPSVISKWILLIMSLGSSCPSVGCFIDMLNTSLYMDHIVYEIKYNIHKTAKEDTKEQPNLGFPVSSLP